MTARWWHRAGEHIACDLCPRACSLSVGQQGHCYVRRASADGMKLDTHGKASGFSVDPIELLPLFHHLPGTATLSLGTAGCNLGCAYCDCWPPARARIYDAATGPASPEAVAAAAHRLECRSVAFTHNDPVVYAEYAIEIAQACRALDIGAVAKTAGYILPQARAELFGVLDAVNVDLKAFTEAFYRDQCHGSLEPVKETLRWIRAQGRPWLELTTLLVPGENDADSELHAMCEWIVRELGADVPLHFATVRPEFDAAKPGTRANLHRARAIAVASGLRYVYLSEVEDPAFESTCCPACGEMLVERDAGCVTTWHIQEGACPRCHAHLPGRFERVPGLWGSRRMPVRGSTRRRQPGP